MNKILTVFAILFLASCQDTEVTGNDPSTTTTLSARVERAQGVSVALYDSAYTVNVSLTAGSSYQRTLTPAFSDHGCDFTGVPVGVPYSLSFQGLNRSGTMIWSGTATGTTASSTTDGSVSATSVTVVVAPTIARDSTLSALSTSPGTFTATFLRTTTSYVDSVAAGVTSVAVTATANTSGDVSGITYNSQTSNVVALSTTDPTAIPVVVTNRNGNSLPYTIKVYHKKPAVIDSTFGIPWNSSITYGSLTDSRDGQSYRTVTIGSQVWMAQNLNYRNTTGGKDTLGVCYGNSMDSCTKYGRQYTWSEAMAGANTSNASPSGVQGVCPTGWHLPSNSEWGTLISAAGGNQVAGLKLKSQLGWMSNGKDTGNGNDAFGFRAIPAGMTNSYAGERADWWSTTEYGSGNAYDPNIYYYDSATVQANDREFQDLSLRCVNDTAKQTTSQTRKTGYRGDEIGVFGINTCTLLPVDSFTIEYWFYPDSNSYLSNFGTYATGAETRWIETNWNFGSNPNRVYFENWPTFDPNTIAATPATELVRNQWHHVASTWNGSVGRIFVDGKKLYEQSASTIPTCNTSTKVVIASYGGALDNIRWSHSIRYTTDFSPAQTFQKDAATAILWNFDGKDSASRLIDEVSGLKLVTDSTSTWVVR